MCFTISTWTAPLILTQSCIRSATSPQTIHSVLQYSTPQPCGIQKVFSIKNFSVSRLFTRTNCLLTAKMQQKTRSGLNKLHIQNSSGSTWRQQLLEELGITFRSSKLCQKTAHLTLKYCMPMLIKTISYSKRTSSPSFCWITWL